MRSPSHALPSTEEVQAKHSAISFVDAMFDGLRDTRRTSLTGESRADLSMALSTTEPLMPNAETLPMALARFKGQFATLLEANKNVRMWKAISKRLGRHPDALQKILTMQGGGQLFYIKKDGTCFFKDSGTEPVLFGYEHIHKDSPAIEIHHRDPKKMSRILRWASTEELREVVKSQGFRLFDYSHLLARAAHVNNDSLLVGPDSDNKEASGWRECLLEDGLRAIYDDGKKEVRILEDMPYFRSSRLGVIRYHTI